MHVKIQDLGFWNIAYFDIKSRDIYINEDYVYNKTVYDEILKHELKHLINTLEYSRLKAFYKDIRLDDKEAGSTKIYKYFPLKVRIKITLIEILTLGLIELFMKRDGHWYLGLIFGDIKLS